MCKKEIGNCLSKFNFNTLAHRLPARWRCTRFARCQLQCLDGLLNIYQPSWRTVVDNSIDVVSSRAQGDSVVIMANIMAPERCHGEGAGAGAGAEPARPGVCQKDCGLD